MKIPTNKKHERQHKCDRSCHSKMKDNWTKSMKDNMKMTASVIHEMKGNNEPKAWKTTTLPSTVHTWLHPTRQPVPVETILQQQKRQHVTPSCISTVSVHNKNMWHNSCQQCWPLWHKTFFSSVKLICISVKSTNKEISSCKKKSGGCFLSETLSVFHECA